VEHWPSEVEEIAGLFSIRGGRYFRHILVPALFPALVTGSILAWGGGFNATIVSEYVNIGHKVYSIPGLGSALDKASNAGDTQQLMILLIVMSGTVVLLNHFVWRRLLTRASLHVIAEE
jgi:NitT/TauT family transport system permease protein